MNESSIKPEVRARWLAFTRQFEGWLDFFYLDVRGLVTLGYGQLVDPFGAALAFDYIDAVTAQPVRRERVKAAWDAVKAAQSLKQHGGGVFRLVRGNDVRATIESIERAAYARLAENDAALRSALLQWDDMPWQAQMAALSLAWAMGPGFVAHFPKWKAALNAGDYAGAAEECGIDTAGNPGVRPRNSANKALLLAAAGK